MQSVELQSLPEKWVWSSLDEILNTLESGGRPKGGVKQYSSGIPSIGGEHLDNNGDFNFNKIRFIPTSFYDAMNKGKIKKFDVLVVKDGATTGKTSLVKESFPYAKAAVNEHVFILRGNEKIITQPYLFCFLYSIEGQNQIQEKFQGSAQGGINSNFVKNFRIPIASIPEQIRIIDKIEELFKESKSARKALDKIPEIMKKFRQSIISSFFTNHNDTSWVKLKDLLKEPLRNGKSALPSKNNKGIPILKLSAVTFKDFSSSNIKICNLKKENVDDLWVKNSDIFIARSNTMEYVGMGVMYEGPDNRFIFPDLMIRVRVNENEIKPKFLAFFLDSNFARDHFRGNAGGTAGSMPKISQTDIENLLVPVPSLSEQDFIIRKIVESFSFADQIEKSVEEAKKRTDLIDQAILAKAFRGELVPQDPNDEPASVLLERIQKERELEIRS